MIVEMTVKLHIESAIFPDDGQVQDVREITKLLEDDYRSAGGDKGSS